jgi:hypothetical protein
MNNFDRLNKDCESYIKLNYEDDFENKFHVSIEYDYDILVYTYGFTPFDTFKDVINVVKKPKRFIIFGSSTGYQLFFWNKLYPDVPAIGIELMSTRIDWGLEKMAEYQIENVMMIEGDLLDFEVKDGDLIWQNNLLFDLPLISDYNKKLLSQYDIQIISYNDIEIDSNLIIDISQNYKKVECDNLKLKTSWKEDQDFFIYNKVNEEEVLFDVEYIPIGDRIIEKNLQNYDSMLDSRKIINSKKYRDLFNKNTLKNLFNKVGFNTPETYLYSESEIDLEKELNKLKSFVAKPAHRSESVDVFIKSEESKLNLTKISDRLNNSLKISDCDFFRKQKLSNPIWWKNCKKGIIVEQYIDVIYELKVFVIFGIPIIGDLRTGSREYDRVDFIKKDNSYIDWSKEYDLIKKLALELKLEFFRIDFLYDGENLYASEMAIMPGTDLPENIENLIYRNWSRPYIKFYYPELIK